MKMTEKMATADAGEMQMRGFIITEDNDFALKDLGNAMEALAMLCEDGANVVAEMPGEMWAGLLRTFARQATAIHQQAAFANRASARPRGDLH